MWCRASRTLAQQQAKGRYVGQGRLWTLPFLLLPLGIVESGFKRTLEFFYSKSCKPEALRWILAKSMFHLA